MGIKDKTKKKITDIKDKDSASRGESYDSPGVSRQARLATSRDYLFYFFLGSDYFSFSDMDSPSK